MARNRIFTLNLVILITIAINVFADMSGIEIYALINNETIGNNVYNVINSSNSIYVWKQQQRIEFSSVTAGVYMLTAIVRLPENKINIRNNLLKTVTTYLQINDSKIISGKILLHNCYNDMTDSLGNTKGCYTKIIWEK